MRPRREGRGLVRDAVNRLTPCSPREACGHERRHVRASFGADAAGRRRLPGPGYGAGHHARASCGAQIRAQRWQSRVHTQSVAVHTGPLARGGRRWAAVFEAATARLPRREHRRSSPAGWSTTTEDVIRVSVPRGVLVATGAGLDIRQTRRCVRDRPRVRRVYPARASRGRRQSGLRCGRRSDKQATLLLTMAVQQGLTTPERSGGQLLDRAPRPSPDADAPRWSPTCWGRTVAGRARVRHGSVADAGCPSPTARPCGGDRDGRCVPRRLLGATWGVVVEIDGIQHEWATSTSSPTRFVTTRSRSSGSIVLRLPLLGLRVAADDFFDAGRARRWRAGVARRPDVDVRHGRSRATGHDDPRTSWMRPATAMTSRRPQSLRSRT